jgi:hypothetical protein
MIIYIHFVTAPYAAQRIKLVMLFCNSGLLSVVENRLNGKTTSKVERVMRTVNMRANVSKWSTSGALNVTKVRLAYYYNGFDA